MTIQEFIPYWQPQPFRPFQLLTSGGSFPVPTPLHIALTPGMDVAVIVETSGSLHVELVPLAQIRQCEFTGPPQELAELIPGIEPARLTRISQLLAAVTMETAPATAEEKVAPAVSSVSSGSLTFHSSQTPEGVLWVHVVVADRDGETMFSTFGTRWNLHGVESFESGTSLYLHHLDNPTVEQRVILWPPDRGTFQSFSEAQSPTELTAELVKRDAQWTEKPAVHTEPTQAYLRRIARKFPFSSRNDALALLGREDPGPDRFALQTVTRKTAKGASVRNVQVTDTLLKSVLFDLTGTDWHCLARSTIAPDQLSLRYGPKGPALKLTVDWIDGAAIVNTDPTVLPLSFVARQLIHFQLHEHWPVLLAALSAGPVSSGEPELKLPAPTGFQLDLWPGEPHVALPFLQPRIVDPRGRTLVDFRTSNWGAVVRVNPAESQLALQLISSAPGERINDPSLEVWLDLVTHRVSSRHFAGWTPLGLFQRLVRTVSGVPWMREELPLWLAKGKSLPG